MTSRQFVAVALRVFALWMGVFAVQSILSIFILTEDFSAAAYVLYAVTYAVVAAFLWMFPLKIAGHVLSSDSGEAPMNVTQVGIVHAAIIAAGLILLVHHVPSLLNMLAFAFANPDQRYPVPLSQSSTLVRIAIPTVQVILALVMVFRAPALARALQSKG